MSSAAAPPAGPVDTGRRIHLGLVIVFLIGVFVQFYLAGRGVFVESHDYEPHKMLGNILHLLSLIILIASIAIPSTRNRRDIGMAAVLFVLVTIQAAIGSFDHPDVGAFHPVNALLIVGLSFDLLARDRAAMAAPA